MKKSIIFALCLMLIFAYPVQAHEDSDISEKYTVLNLTETVTKKVAQDRLQASLAVDEKSMSATEAQDAANKKMEAGLKIAKTFTDVKVSTGYYQTWQENPSGIWHVRHSIEVNSANSKQILELVGQLQKAGLQAGGLSYYLSEEAQRALYDALLEEALQKLKSRAGKMAETLGLKVIRFAEINPGYNQPPMPYGRGAIMMRADAAEAAPMTAPSAEAGEQNVSVTVGARVYLQ